MTKLRTALLVAAATLAGMPALVAAQTPPGRNDGRPDRDHGERDRGERDYRGNHERSDRGPGGQFDRGGRAQDAQAQRPQAQQVQPSPPPPPQAPPPQARDRGDDRRGPGRGDGAEGRRNDRDGAFRRGFGPGDGRPDPRRDPRFAPNAPGRPGSFAEGPNDRGRPGWDHRRPGWDRGGQGWDRGGPGWDRDRGPGGWRADRRYDWRGWRERNRALFRGPRYAPPRVYGYGYGYGYRAFSPGFTLEPLFYERSYWIEDPFAYRLPPADGPYRWVRYYNDVLLVDLRSGTIVDVIRDFFW